MNANVLLYDDFETLDAFGPVNILGQIPEHFHINYLSRTGDIINSSQGLKVWTEPLSPGNVGDILIIPGGRGARRLIHHDGELIQMLKECVANVDACLMIASGSALLAQTGVLFHRKIADYPGDKNWKRMFTAGISRVPGLRWMADGKFYSSSSTISGIDMTLGLVADILDIDVAVKAAQHMGYIWEPDAGDGIYC